MTTLDQVPATRKATHLLLCADTKLGKSTYVAQAAIDGYTVIYLDSDNGLGALQTKLAGNPEAMKRVLYFRTESPVRFLIDFFIEGIFRWNITEDMPFKSGTAKSTSQMVEIIPAKIPLGVVLAIDSWTSVSLDALNDGAGKKNLSLEDLTKDRQGVYGEAGNLLTLILSVIQKVSINVIAIAHGTFYERYRKPDGVKNPQQKEMILEETIQVPVSSSRPHGHTMGKFFTDIGWLTLDNADERILDFRVMKGRVGGGTIDKKGKLSEMSFKNLFGPSPEVTIDESWIRYYTTAEFTARNNPQTVKPAVQVAPAAQPESTQGAITSKPTTSLSAMLKK